jgi:hypothetical protein
MADGFLLAGIAGAARMLTSTRWLTGAHVDKCCRSPPAHDGLTRSNGTCNVRARTRCRRPSLLVLDCRRPKGGLAMDVETVRERATAFCEALDSGDVEAATAYMSPELRRNLGEVVALLPLPSSGSDVVAAERAGSGFDVVLRLIGPADEVELQTRWKDRDGEPTLVEASHLRRTERVAPEGDSGEDEGEPAGVEG